MPWFRAFIPGVVTIMTITATAAAEPVRVHAAGSLHAAISDIAEAFERNHGTAVEATFAPSGLLRQRIAAGERADIFASANMRHPRALAESGLGGPVVMFARNRLCGLARPEVQITTADFLARILDPSIRLGTSTPKADPSGDYAWALFEKAERVRPGSFEILSQKARKLTGGPDSPKPPAGRNTYAWIMTADRADVFLTYCTNTVLAQKDTPDLRIVHIPDDLSVGADYGLSLLRPDAPEAARFALFVLSLKGQGILADYGFTAPALP